MDLRYHSINSYFIFFYIFSYHLLQPQLPGTRRKGDNGRKLYRWTWTSKGQANTGEKANWHLADHHLSGLNSFCWICRSSKSFKVGKAEASVPLHRWSPGPNADAFGIPLPQTTKFKTFSMFFFYSNRRGEKVAKSVGSCWLHLGGATLLTRTSQFCLTKHSNPTAVRVPPVLTAPICMLSPE